MVEVARMSIRDLDLMLDSRVQRVVEVLLWMERRVVVMLISMENRLVD